MEAYKFPLTPGRQAVTSLPPNLICQFDDHPQFRPLLLLGENVSFLGGGKTALRRQAKLIERNIFRRFVDPSLDVVFWLKAPALRRHQAEHQLLLALGKMAQRPIERLRATIVVRSAELVGGRTDFGIRAAPLVLSNSAIVPA